ncbi:glycosyltransferase [Alcanivorax sp.]|uniref:glycosyltransferase n=1 Tax=Alcanivorax sp. TaxID=1872427 RepID=UPI00258AA280|nr:glycosyltransferase [Alcanivorax sp.]
MSGDDVLLSVVTATYNVEEKIPSLISSLARQSDQKFEWVVADGGSNDSTLELVNNAASVLENVKIDSRPDCGIYDALNRAVKIAEGDYYLVVGADDELTPGAVESFRKACKESEADFVTALIDTGRNIKGVRRPGWRWLYGPFAYVSGHAVGLAIRRSLHDRFGFYSLDYHIASDQLFILRAVDGGAVVSRHDFVAGRFDPGGTSAQDLLATLMEGFRVQVTVGESPLIQFGLLGLRILKNLGRIKANLR